MLNVIDYEVKFSPKKRNWMTKQTDQVHTKTLYAETSHRNYCILKLKQFLRNSFLIYMISLSVHQRIFPLTSIFQERIWFQERMFQILATHFAYQSSRVRFYFIWKLISPCIFPTTIMSKLPCNPNTHQ